MQRLIAGGIAVLFVLTACVSGPLVETNPVPGPDPDPPRALGFALQSFDSCDSLLGYLKKEALARVTAYGLPGTGYWGPIPFTAIAEDGLERSATTQAAAVPGVDYSATNVQEAGVDEPDFVKTDGNRILVLAQGKLYFVDVSTGEPMLRGSLSVPYSHGSSLFLHGDSVLVVSSGFNERGFAGDRIGPWYGGSPITTIEQVDVSDPDDLKVTRTLQVDGSFLSSRMVDGVARLVLSTPPLGLEFVTPDRPGLRGERDSLRENQKVIRESNIEDWLPYYVLEDHNSGGVTEGILLDCTRAAHPEEFAGFSTLTVLSADLDQGLMPRSSFGLFADGAQVYGTSERLFVSTPRWIDWSQDPDDLEDIEPKTWIHAFEIGDQTTYLASGSVKGYPYSQWAFDEHDGHLRVATTTANPVRGWIAGETESRVTILEVKEGTLDEVGMVNGLGKGERIYAVRFIDDTGYVVTFRQVDPLYTIDLADPSSPSVVGELKIPGYSAYLHPIGDGLLLGVGQDADENGRIEGSQVAVFDVTDPANPRRLHKFTMKGGHSEAEWDHHAFLHWAKTGLTVLPLQVYSWDEPTGKEDFFSGAIAISAGRDGIEHVGEIVHPSAFEEDEWHPNIRRSIVIGDTLMTVSEFGILASDLETLDEMAWMAFEA